MGAARRSNWKKPTGCLSLLWQQPAPWRPRRLLEPECRRYPHVEVTGFDLLDRADVRINHIGPPRANNWPTDNQATGVFGRSVLGRCCRSRQSGLAGSGQRAYNWNALSKNDLKNKSIKFSVARLRSHRKTANFQREKDPAQARATRRGLEHSFSRRFAVPPVRVRRVRALLFLAVVRGCAGKQAT